MLTVEGLIEGKNKKTIDGITDIFCDAKKIMEETSEIIDDIDEKKSSENNPIWKNISKNCQDTIDKLACIKSIILCNMETIDNFESAVKRMNN